MNAIFKGVISAGKSMVFGLLSSVLIGVLIWSATYPVRRYDCRAYGESKELAWKFRFFECYIHTKDGWMTKQEYQSSFVGARIIISKEAEKVLDE